MLSAYIDESGTNKESPAMSVAGLLYEKWQARQLDREWKKCLGNAGVKFFHTVDYAHLRGEFQGKDRNFSNELYHQLIAQIKKYACGGAAVITLPEHEFAACVRDSRFYWPYSQYTTCAHMCMLALRSIARRLDLPRHIDFSIESGHKDMGQLRTFAREVLHPKLPGTYNFRDKRNARPLQTADVWAYEMTKRVKDQILRAKRSMRKSLQILIEKNPNMQVIFLGKDRLQLIFQHVTDQMLTD